MIDWISRYKRKVTPQPPDWARWYLADRQGTWSWFEVAPLILPDGTWRSYGDGKVLPFTSYMHPFPASGHVINGWRFYWPDTLTALPC